MWGYPTLFYLAKSIEKIFYEKINVDTVNGEKLFPPGKSYLKKY